MFDSISPLPSKTRRTATLCSAAVHTAAVAALWTAGHAITAPPIPPYEPRQALLVVSPPPRLLRPRPRPKTPARRFAVEPTAVARIPEAIREAPEAPKVEARADPAPILPTEPEVAVPRPAAKPVGFAEVARTAAPKLELEPQAAAFGAALGSTSTSKPALAGGGTAFGAVSLAGGQSPTAATGDGGFGGVEMARAAQRTDLAGEAGFAAAVRGPADVTTSEPTPAGSKNRPIKIVWKPVPQYSEEGIRRRIEGDVVLLVRFLAEGTIETLKIVSGLGYGLDEYALQAAKSIRFEPATEGDQPIDYTAQVRIRFQLAY